MKTPNSRTPGRLHAAAALAVALLAGCAAPRAPIGLVPVPPAQLRQQPLGDDAGFDGLADALRQSLRYFRRLPETRVDDFEPFVAESPSHDLGSAVVAVEAGLGDEYLDRSIGHGPIVGSERITGLA